MDQQALAEYRYRAVREVLGGSPIGEVAERYGTTRQSLHSWRKRFEAEGMPGLTDRSRRPKTSPSRVDAEVEAVICRLRREHPRWGARRLSFELGQRGIAAVPGRATVHRVLARNGLVKPQEQRHGRKYKRWQRDAPMQLWQLDIVGGVPLAGGREAKIVTGIDDCSRFVVVSAVILVQSGRAVTEAFAAAMRRYGVPFEVLTDNGKQFTGRHIRPQPVEVLFERVCRENGILQRHTKPRSPTTTGKIERFHKSLRAELLDHVAPFESLQAAQAAIDGWVHAYNHQRPHQALDMAVPASRFRPNGPARDVAVPQPTPADERVALPWADEGTVAPPPLPIPRSAAVEFEVRVSPGGTVIIVAGRQSVSFKQGMAGRTLTVWADLHSIHLLLDGHLMHAIAGGALAGTWPCPVTAERAARMNGARAAASPLPPAPLPAGSIAARRRVHPDGRIIVNKQRMKLGPRHAGKLVTVIIEDTCYRILHGEEELAVKPRKDTSPITRLYVRGMKTQT